MLIFLLICSLIFTTLLVWATLKESPYRFWIKLIACAQFVVLAFVARYYSLVMPEENTILIGLICAFFGDLFLGLRKVSKLFFLAGLLMFIIAQLAYLSALPFNWDMLSVFMILGVAQGLWMIFFYRGKTVQVHGLIRPLLGLYDVCLIGVASLSFVTFLAVSSMSNSMRVYASMAFLLSDTILFGVYFVKPKSKVQIIAYLTLYHLAQTLYALSLWY